MFGTFVAVESAMHLDCELAETILACDTWETFPGHVYSVFGNESRRPIKSYRSKQKEQMVGRRLGLARVARFSDRHKRHAPDEAPAGRG